MTARTPAELLLAASRELLLLVDPVTLEILAVNACARELLGWAEDQMVGRAITEFETALQDVFYWAEAADGHFSELTNAEGLYACANGDFLPVEKSIRWLADAVPPAIVICARDARAQVNATTRLLEASAILQATFESTAEGFLVLTRAGRVLNYNRRCVDVWRDSAEGADARSELRLLRRVVSQAEKPREAIKSWRKLVRQDAEEYSDDFALRDGRIIRCRSRPLMMQEQMEGRVISFSDITLGIQREQELAAARDAAAASAKAKADFLAMMSHEIRTPLTGILGMTELILDTDLSVVQREYLEMSNQSAKGLLTIINDILDFSRIEAGKLQIESIPFDLVATIKRSTRPLIWQAQQRGLSLDLLLPASPALWLLGDSTRVQQIVINLVGNAIKFTENGSVSVEISSQVEDSGLVAVGIAVRDTGIGISSEKLGQIFDAFTQADASTNRRFGGTGLGLAISNRLARLMGGQIEVDSVEGQGSCFHIRLRLPAAEAPAMATIAAQDSAVAMAGLSVLLAEDTKVNQVFLTSILKKWGHRSVVCNNGEEAVEMALHGNQAFDLILMDIQMPIMDGFAATKLLRAAGVTTPVIALTAHATEGFREECIAKGMTDYLAKPVDTRQLQEKIWRYAALAAGALAAPTANPEPLDKDGPPVFDTAAALDRLDGDDDIFRMLIGEVQAQIGDDMANLRRAVLAADGGQLAQQAHRLKGSLSAVGAMRAHQLCGRLEEAGKSGENSAFEHLLSQLDQSLAQLGPLLSAYTKQTTK